MSVAAIVLFPFLNNYEVRIDILAGGGGGWGGMHSPVMVEIYRMKIHEIKPRQVPMETTLKQRTDYHTLIRTKGLLS